MMQVLEKVGDGDFKLVYFESSLVYFMYFIVAEMRGSSHSPHLRVRPSSYTKCRCVTSVRVMPEETNPVPQALPLLQGRQVKSMQSRARMTFKFAEGFLEWLVTCLSL